MHFINLSLQKISFEKFEKVYSGLIGTLIFMLIMYALYAAAQKNRTMFINGVQGRYFIPIMWLVPIFMNKNKIEIKDYSVINTISILVKNVIKFL